MKKLLIPALLSGFTLLTSAAVYRKAFYNKNDKDVTWHVLRGPQYDPYHDEMVALIRKAVGIPYREVRIRSFDGKTLFGRLYLQKEGAPFHLQFNGYKGNGIRDFSGGLQLALSLGENVLLTDQRSHGKSEGHTITFGIRERKDVLSWISYVNNTYSRDTEIWLEGVSMGAATVLMASDLDLPENVQGIVADCPYSSPFRIVSQVASGITGIPHFLDPFIVIGAALFGGFNIFAASAVRAVKHAKVPILMIHGTDDRFVPLEMSRKILDANPAMVTLAEFPGAPHGLSCLKDYERYRKVFLDFVHSRLQQA